MPRLFMLWLALAPVLLYLGLCGFLYARQRSLIYYPQFTTVDADRTDFEFARDGVTLRRLGAQPGTAARPALLRRQRGIRAIQPQRLRALVPAAFGVSARLPRLRRQRGRPHGTVGDALALYDRVRDRHPAGIDVIGRSLGSGVASRLAAERPVRRLALVTPFDSMASLIQAHYRWLPARWLTRDRFDSVRHLSGYRGPVLVVRAGRD